MKHPTSLRLLAVVTMTFAMLTATLASGMTASTAAAAEPSRVVSGWFGWWTSPADMVSVAKNSNGVLGEVNIFWWQFKGADKPICTTVGATECQTDGPTPWTTPRFAEAVAGLHALGIDVYATQTDLDYKRAGSLSSYLASKANRHILADKLTTWAVNAGVDGVDLDWENFAFNDGASSWPTTQPRFVTMIKLLSQKLHAAGKKLSVTVPGGYQPFRSDGSPNPGGGYTVYAWSQIADHVDRLRLMTYDYSWNRPGPIGPDAWTRSSVRSAIAQVGEANKSKIYVGVHSYGKAWYVRDSNDNPTVIGNCPSGWSPSGRDAISMNPTEARELAAAYGVTPRFDNTYKEWTFRYEKTESGNYTTAANARKSKDCKVLKEVWFGAAETAEARGALVKETGIGGLSVWELSSLDPKFFSVLAPYANKPGTSPKPSASPQPSTTPSPSPTTLGPLGKLQATVSKPRPKAGKSVVVSGQLAPTKAGVKVKRHSYINGKWRKRGFVMSSTTGAARFRVALPKKPGKFKFRLTAKTPETKRIYSTVIKVKSVKKKR